MSHEDFFRRFGDWAPQMVHEYGTATRLTTEHMYQAFKARMMAELAVGSDELLRPGVLVDSSIPPTEVKP